MERTDRQLNGTVHPAPEGFYIQDPATGKARCVREMLDPELARWAVLVGQDLPKLNAQLGGALNALTQAQRMHAAICYEIERRAKGLAIAREMPN